MEQHAIPWYKSKVLVGAGVSVLAQVLKLTGLVHHLGSDDVDQISDVIVQGASVIGAAVAVGGRLTQKHAPVVAVTAASAQAKSDAIAAAAPIVADEIKSPGDVATALGDVAVVTSAAATLAPDVPFLGQAAALEQEIAHGLAH